MENNAFISLGSNMEDRYDYLKRAVELLNKQGGIKVVNISSIYETDPVGYEDQAAFLNMVIQVFTEWKPLELLDILMNIETELGRKREVRWGPRTLDLDILMYNQENIETERLIVPHPRMKERAFVLIPLSEIDSDLNIPGLGKPVAFFLDHLDDREGVRLWKRKNGEDVFAPIES